MRDTAHGNLDLRFMKWIGVFVATFGFGVVLPVVAVVFVGDKDDVLDGGFFVTLFIIDAAIIWTGVAMVLAAGRLAKFQRVLDGRCAYCNYHLRGLDPSAVCPECGNARAGGLAP